MSGSEGGDMSTPSFATAAVNQAAHRQLTEAHRDACSKAGVLRQYLMNHFPAELAATQRLAIELGAALEKMARAERECSCCSGAKHVFPENYQHMLDQHRLAFLDFESLSREIENGLPFDWAYLSRLAADIEHHLCGAEQVHQETLTAAA